MLLLLPLFSVRARRASHLQNRQPDLVVAPRNGARAPRARDPAVRLTLLHATPHWHGPLLAQLIGFLLRLLLLLLLRFLLLLMLLLLLAVGRVTQVAGVKAKSIVSIHRAAGIIECPDGFEDLRGKVSDIWDLCLREVSRGVPLFPASRPPPRCITIVSRRCRGRGRPVQRGSCSCRRRRRPATTKGNLPMIPPSSSTKSLMLTCTGCPVRLINIFCWHQIKSCDGTFVLMSTNASNTPDGAPCNILLVKFINHHS